MSDVHKPMVTIEQIIKAIVDRFGNEDHPDNLKAPVKTKMISTPEISMRVRVPTEKVLYLPNGHKVHVMTDATGKATEIDDGEHLHAIVRPDTYRRQARVG